MAVSIKAWMSVLEAGEKLLTQSLQRRMGRVPLCFLCLSWEGVSYRERFGCVSLSPPDPEVSPLPTRLPSTSPLTSQPRSQEVCSALSSPDRVRDLLSATLSWSHRTVCGPSLAPGLMFTHRQNGGDYFKGDAWAHRGADGFIWTGLSWDAACRQAFCD